MRLSVTRILKKISTTIVILLLVTIIAACDDQDLAVAPLPVIPDTAGTTTNVKPVSSQALQLVWLKVYPGEVNQGDDIHILAKAVNSGSTRGTYTAKLLIDGTTRAIKVVVIPAGETQVLDFQLPVYKPGTYQVNLCGLAGQFKVNPETAAYSNNSQNTITQPAGSSTASGCCGTPAPAVTTQPTASSGCCATLGKGSASPAGSPSITVPKRSSGGCCP